MKELTDIYLETINRSLQEHPTFYTILSVIAVLAYSLGRDLRKWPMKKLARELNLSFRPYVFKWDLFPILSFIIKRYSIGEPLNMIEGIIDGRYILVFDFYFLKTWSFSGGNKKDKLITFINGDYYENVDTEVIKKRLLKKDFSAVKKENIIDEYLRFRQIAILHTYWTLKLKGIDIELNNLRRIIQTFQSVNYKSFTGKYEEVLLVNKLNYPIEVIMNEMKLQFKKRNFQVPQELLTKIINEYVDNLQLQLSDSESIMKDINLKKLE